MIHVGFASFKLTAKLRILDMKSAKRFHSKTLKAKFTEKLQEKHYAQNEMILKSVFLYLEKFFFSGS